MFQYLPYIEKALENLYKNDGNLFEGKTHEQTFSYRIALYLSQQLEKEQKDMFIDCEYHRNLDSDIGKKFIDNYEYFRPDIIFHNRARRNMFCIELKKHSLTYKTINGQKFNDKDKIEGMINTFGYVEGFCIYNLNKNRVTVWCKSQSEEETKIYTWKNNRLTKNGNKRRIQN